MLNYQRVYLPWIFHGSSPYPPLSDADADRWLDQFFGQRVGRDHLFHARTWDGGSSNENHRFLVRKNDWVNWENHHPKIRETQNYLKIGNSFLDGENLVDFNCQVRLLDGIPWNLEGLEGCWTWQNIGHWRHSGSPEHNPYPNPMASHFFQDFLQHFPIQRFFTIPHINTKETNLSGSKQGFLQFLQFPFL